MAAERRPNRDLRNLRYLVRSNRNAFATTITDAPVSASTAIHNVADPVTAITRNAAFSSSETTTFVLTLRIVARARRSAYGQLEQLVRHQRDVGGFEGHVGAGCAHRHADVGRGQRRRIVDPVPHHHHRAVIRPRAP